MSGGTGAYDHEDYKINQEAAELLLKNMGL